MTIEQYAPSAEIAVSDSQDVAIRRLAEWAHSAEAAHHIATTLVQTSFCPDQFRGKAGEATAAILAGMEVGLQPMAALRSFDIINNTAAPRAITLRAIVQSQGHEIEIVESTATRCKMRGRRRGSSDWQSVVWSIERAQQLGVTGKSNWKSQPQAMLVARATSEMARLVASDAILGLPYSAEEVADGGNYEQQVNGDTTAVSAPSGTRRMSRPQTSDPEDAPGSSASTDPVEPAASGSESPLLNTSSGLAKKMFALFGDIGLTERADRLAYVASVIGHDVESSAAMTDADAVATIGQLEADLAQPFEPTP